MKKPGLPKYADIADLEEDKRIDVIGDTVSRLQPGQTLAFVTDDTPGKADRYVAKLAKKYPGVSVLKRFPGPTPGTVCVKVGPTPRN